MLNQQIYYKEYNPSKQLVDYINCYWYFKITTTTIKTFDVLPDACFDLLFIIKENGDFENVLTGIWNKSLSIEYKENTQILGIRFKPLSIHTIFKFEINNYLNHKTSILISDLELNYNYLVDSIQTNLSNAINYLNQLFMFRINNSFIDNRLQNCYKLIETNKGTISIASISDKVGISSRQLNRIVNAKIGISLKEYSKIIRFKSFINIMLYEIDKSNILYYDQSHLIKDFKNYTGKTPKQIKISNNDRFLQFYKVY